MGRRERDIPDSRLRTVRRRLSSTTLSQFATTAGYSASYLSAVELGYLPVTTEVLLAYERTLGLSAGELTPGAGSGVAKMLAALTSPELGTDVPFSWEAPKVREGKLTTFTPLELMAARLNLIRDANEAEPGRIVITSRGNDTLTPGLEPQWTQGLRALIRQGWKITHILRLDDDMSRNLNIIESMFELLVTGSYQPMYIKERTSIASFNDVLVIPGAGALLSFPSLEENSTGILVRHADEVRAIEDYCAALEAVSLPLVERVVRSRPLDFERLLLQGGRVAGDRLFVRDGAWPLAYPKSWYSETSNWSRRSGLVGDELRQLVEVRIERTELLEEHLKTSHYLSISPKSAITHFIRTGLRPYDERDGSTVEPMTPEERHELIECLIKTLSSYENYELALLDDSDLELLQPSSDASIVFWTVFGDDMTLLETWPLDDNGRPTSVHIAIREPSVTQAFIDHFKDVWNHIPRINRDKEYVTWWLTKELEQVESSVSETSAP